MIWRGYGEMVLDAGMVEVQPAIIIFCTGGELIIYCTATVQENKKTMPGSISSESRSEQSGQQRAAAVGGGS